jgi:hypothetical protein
VPLPPILVKRIAGGSPAPAQSSEETEEGCCDAEDHDEGSGRERQSGVVETGAHLSSLNDEVTLPSTTAQTEDTGNVLMATLDVRRQVADSPFEKAVRKMRRRAALESSFSSTSMSSGTSSSTCSRVSASKVTFVAVDDSDDVCSSQWASAGIKQRRLRRSERNS